MGLKRFIVIAILACIGVVSCAPVKITVDKERPPLGQYEDVILVIPDAIHDYDLSGLYNRLHRIDVFENSEKQKIGNIKLNGTSQDLAGANIYDAVESQCRSMGGNYIVTTKVKLNKRGVGRQYLAADIFYVSDFNGLERKLYWGPEKELKLEDFKAVDYTQKGIFLEDKFTSLNANKDHTLLNGKLHNVFVKERYACPDCDDVDLYRENLKFDIIELYQRKQVKLFHEMMRNDSLRSPHFFSQSGSETYVYIDTINQKFDAINQIDDIKALQYVQSTVSSQIEALETYNKKTFTVANRKYDKVEKGSAN